MSLPFLIGIDEAGRGPIAGPVAVAACLIKEPQHRVLRFFPDNVVRDSKKLTPKARERIFEQMRTERLLGRIDFAVSFAGAALIDRKGISFAVRQALRRSLRFLHVEAARCRVLLDGGLKAPEDFIFQRTIIRGDETEAVIALASVAAKVSRDRRMRRLAKKYPGYCFETHKGYGTNIHYRTLQTYGLSPVHRRSFLQGLSVAKILK